MGWYKPKPMKRPDPAPQPEAVKNSPVKEGPAVTAEEQAKPALAPEPAQPQAREARKKGAK